MTGVGLVCMGAVLSVLLGTAHGRLWLRARLTATSSWWLNRMEWANDRLMPARPASAAYLFVYDVGKLIVKTCHGLHNCVTRIGRP